MSCRTTELTGVFVALCLHLISFHFILIIQIFNQNILIIRFKIKLGKLRTLGKNSEELSSQVPFTEFNNNLQYSLNETNYVSSNITTTSKKIMSWFFSRLHESGSDPMI